jgi:hypothetical protein
VYVFRFQTRRKCLRVSVSGFLSRKELLRRIWANGSDGKGMRVRRKKIKGQRNGNTWARELFWCDRKGGEKGED